MVEARHLAAKEGEKERKGSSLGRSALIVKKPRTIRCNHVQVRGRADEKPSVRLAIKSFRIVLRAFTFADQSRESIVGHCYWQIVPVFSSALIM